MFDSASYKNLLKFISSKACHIEILFIKLRKRPELNGSGSTVLDKFLTVLDKTVLDKFVSMRQHFLSLIDSKYLK